MLKFGLSPPVLYQLEKIVWYICALWSYLFYDINSNPPIHLLHLMSGGYYASHGHCKINIEAQLFLIPATMVFVAFICH